MTRLLFEDPAVALFIAQILVKEGYAVQWLVDNPKTVMTSLDDQAAYHLTYMYAGDRVDNWAEAESINVDPQKPTSS